jgi:myo-inositol-1(or 4)-monophosphatase
MLSQACVMARNAGKLLHDQFEKIQQVNDAQIHDIKLQMDIDCQRLIESQILKAYPDHSIVGEEESCGDPKSEYRWVVDPLDGTVNYAYGIPHFCVSIGLQRRSDQGKLSACLGGYESILGVIYDPMRDELFTAEKGKGAFLNGRKISVSDRDKMNESILSVGFSKTEDTLQRGFQYYQNAMRKVRKIRTMGSAALDLAYVAAGRMEAYLEFKVQLWDIAAGIILVTEAGGDVLLRGLENHSFEVLAWNNKLDLQKKLDLSFE